MLKKLSLIALAVVALAPRSNAGTEMIIDNSAQAPIYDYAPPPRPVYYAPPPVRVVVYPTIGYCPPRFRAYGYERWQGRHRYHRPYRGR